MLGPPNPRNAKGEKNVRTFLGISLFLISTTGVQGAVQYTYSAPALFGEPATQLTYTAMAFVTANTTINLPDPNVVVTTPTSGSVPTQIQILSPNTTAAQFSILYSNGTSIDSNFGVNFLHEGSFPNGSGVRLTIALVPIFTKSFVPPTILLNGTSTLGFNISNPTPLTMMGVAFTDAFPTGLIVATPNGLTGSCGGGSITATVGSSSVGLSGATLAPGATCTFSVNVVGTIEGRLNNSAQVTTANAGNGGTATASLLVGTAPNLTKTFGELAIPVGGSTSLTLTVANPNPFQLTGLQFTDTLPGGLQVATPNGTTGSCGGGTITATAGGGAIILTGATLAAGASCTFAVNVTGAAVGKQNNVTSTVTSNEGVTGPPATASIYVGATNITSQVIIGVDPFSLDRNSRNPNSCTRITLMNPSTPPDRTTRATTFAGPIEVVLTNVSSNATLENPAGTLGGNPYVIAQPSSLPPGEQAIASLCFLNPTGAPITFVPRVYSGALP